MRKRQTHAIAFFFILLTFASILSLYIPKSWAATENGTVQVIPNEAIRLRILANSNAESDQEIKRIVRDRVNEQITDWVSELTSLEEARSVIVDNLDQLQEIAYEVLEENGIVDQAVDIEFKEVAFPTKLYGDLLYPAGIYEAVLIKIGEGKGANWWCVLFPPLCFLDFSSGTAISDGFEEDSSEIEDIGDVEDIVDIEDVDDKAGNAVEAYGDYSVEAQEASGQSVDSVDGQIEIKELVVHEEEEVEVKFFLVEIFQKIFAFIGSLFSEIFG